MGMFDTITLDDAHPVACANGHPLPPDLQTKDWDCNLDDFYFRDGHLRAHKWIGRGDPDNKEDVADDFTGDIEAISGMCETCGQWSNFALRFDKGRLTSVAITP